jgi:HK97 gp10 family phage protein
MGVHIDIVVKRWENLKKVFPDKIADVSLGFYKRNYLRQGWSDKSFQNWRPKKNPNGLPILVKTGHLKRSFAYSKQGFKKIRIFNPVSYAKYHNFGTTKMPKRPFIYKSEKMNDEIKTLLIKELKKLFK